MVYSQILISVSFALASYQDIRQRSISDYAWAPAILGAVFAFGTMYPDIEFLLLKIAIVGVLGVSFYFLGELGAADPIAFAFIVWDPYPFSIIAIMVATSIALSVHVGYAYLRGKVGGKKTIPIGQFLHEQCWIPQAVINGEERTEVDRGVNDAREFVEKAATESTTVEVIYGVPTAAYIGLGYIAYLLYQVLFNLSGLLAFA